jgi:hypothetical protein
MLLYCKNIGAVIQEEVTRNPPRTHALTRDSESVPPYVAESQPLAWTSLRDRNQLSEMRIHVKLADLGAGGDIIHISFVVADEMLHQPTGSINTLST